jgi:heat shock protein HslJ
LLARGAVIAALALATASTSASTPQAWGELDARSAAECSRLAGLADAKVGAPMRFGDELGIDVRVVTGNASCNAYSGRYTLNAGLLTIGELSLASEKSCAPSLMNQERRFVEALGAVRRVELLPTGALLVSGPDGQSLRFFPDALR